MSLFTRSLWPDHVRAPVLRLAIAMVAAPALLVLIGAGVSFVIAGASEATRAGTMAVTTDSAIALAALAALLTVVAAVPGVASLWALGQRGILAWSAAGAAFGAAASALLALLQQGALTPAGMAVGIVFCWLDFLLIRAFAGVRSR